MDIGEGSHLGGKMEVVTGTLYRSDVGVSTFRADHGAGEKESGILTLTGNVEVTSLKAAGTVNGKTKTPDTVYCDTMIWDATKKLIKARGHVRAESQGITMEGAPEVWASADLTTVSTPDIFYKPLKKP